MSTLQAEPQPSRKSPSIQADRHVEHGVIATASDGLCVSDPVVYDRSIDKDDRGRRRDVFCNSAAVVSCLACLALRLSMRNNLASCDSASGEA